jgi:hypothetical protein
MRHPEKYWFVRYMNAFPNLRVAKISPHLRPSNSWRGLSNQK